MCGQKIRKKLFLDMKAMLSSELHTDSRTNCHSDGAVSAYLAPM